MKIKKQIDPNLVQLSAPYQKLHHLIETIDEISIIDWTIMHSLAYICKKYKEKFNADYILSYDGAPSQSYEYRLTSRLWGMLSAKACEGQKVKDYIDWFFLNYRSNNPFRSIGAISKVDLVSKYLQNKQKKDIPTLYTRLPDNVITIMMLCKYEKLQYIRTFGDLYFYSKANELPADILAEFDAIGFNFTKVQ